MYVAKEDEEGRAAVWDAVNCVFAGYTFPPKPKNVQTNIEDSTHIYLL